MIKMEMYSNWLTERRLHEFKANQQIIDQYSEFYRNWISLPTSKSLTVVKNTVR